MWQSGTAAGFTIPQSLEAMGHRPAQRIEAFRTRLLHGTRRGEGIGQLVRSGHPRPDAFESAILTLGDECGRLEESLRLLADYHSRKHRLMLAVRKKMAYPLFTALFATLIAPIPLLVSGRTQAYLVTVVAGLALWLLAGGAVVRVVLQRYARSPALVRARLARALATAIEAGLPLGRAARLAADATASTDVMQFMRTVSERSLSTQPLRVTLSRCPHITPDFLGALEVAEATGDFRLITRLAAMYEDGFR